MAMQTASKPPSSKGASSTKTTKVADASQTTSAKQATRKQVLAKLSMAVGELITENRRVAKRLDTVQKILGMLINSDELKDDPFDLNANMETDDASADEEVDKKTVGGVLYKLGEEVEMYESQKRVWKGTGVIVKFSDHMAHIKPKGKKATRRKYGNFRHVATP